MKKVTDMLTALKEDDNFIRLIRKYESPNCFSIMGEKRREEWHSNFISWLLNPQGNHKLGVFPLFEFLKLYNSKIEPENKIIISKLDIEDMEFQNEVTIPEGRVDIVGKTKDRSLILIIENKIDAGETFNGKTSSYQTDTYYEHYKNCDYGQKCFVYLTPYSYKRPYNKNFISITYQELFDCVISHCINCSTIEVETKYVLEQYAINISNPKVGRTHMAHTEKQISEIIYNNHKSVFHLLRDYMNDINRDNASPVCEFYENYKEYINEILGAVGENIITPRTETKPKGKDLIKMLCEAGIIEPDKTKLITSRHGATYIIQVCIINGEYKCNTGYFEGKKDSEYTGEDVELLMEGGDVVYFDTIGKAAVAVETAHMKGKVSSNPGPAAGQWRILYSGERRPDAEGKRIDEIYNI